MAPQPDKDAAAIEAMMMDLGDQRLEELAKEDDRHGRRDARRLQFPAQSIHSDQKKQEVRVPSNPFAGGWNIAVTSGHFQDSDALNVSNLDTIAGGRLHALNREHPGTGRDRRVGNQNVNRVQTISWQEIKDKSRSQDVSCYDPINPGKQKAILPRRRDFLTSDDHRSGPAITMGAIESNGPTQLWGSHTSPAKSPTPAAASTTNSTSNYQPAKQWNSFRPAERSVIQAALANAIPEPASATPDGHREARGAITNGPRKSFAPTALQDEITADTTQVNRLDSEQLIPPPGLPVTPHLQATPAESTTAKHAADARSASRGIASAAKASTQGFVPPHLRMTSHVARSPAASVVNDIPPTPTIVSPVACTTSTTLSHPGALSAIANGDEVAPHRPHESRIESQAHISPLIATPRQERASATTGPAPQSAPVSLDSAQPTLFFEAKIRAARTVKSSGNVKVFSGKMYVYQYPGRNAAIWELRWSDGFVIREDFRAFVPPMSNGSRLMVRRQDHPGQILRTTQIRVDTAALGAEFSQICKALKPRFESSDVPWYPFTEEQGNPADYDSIDLTTLLPLAGSSEYNKTVTDKSVSTQSTDCVSKPSTAQHSAMTPTTLVVDKLVLTELPTAHPANQLPTFMAESAPTELLQDQDQCGYQLTLEDDALGDMVRDLDQHDVREEAGRPKEEEEASQARQVAEEALAACRQAELELEQEARARASTRTRDADIIVKREINRETNEKTEMQARRARLEEKVATPSRSAEVLIDTSFESPDSQGPSYANDLQGMVYELPSTSAVNTDKSIPTTSSSIIKQALPELRMKLEPVVSSEPALILTDNQDRTGQQVAQVDAGEEGSTINAAKLANVSLGTDLTVQSMAILCQLNIAHYCELSRAFDEQLYWMKQMGPHTSGSVHDAAGVQVTIIHLARHTAFKRLDNEERIKTAAVVFHNLRRLKTGHRIKYSMTRIFELKPYARRVHASVILANECLALAKDARSGRAPGTAFLTQKLVSSARQSFSLSPPSFANLQTSFIPRLPTQSRQASPTPPTGSGVSSRQTANQETQTDIRPWITVERPEEVAARTLLSAAIQAREDSHAFQSHQSVTRSQATAVTAAQPSTPSTNTTMKESRPVPPHLRRVGYQTGLGASRWA
ncbi:hypothetical protein TruAng_002911 [Truncatella angustata]|nr:hypothetical protein TruAng_002911 [Truncatella angustata]